MYIIFLVHLLLNILLFLVLLFFFLIVLCQYRATELIFMCIFVLCGFINSNSSLFCSLQYFLHIESCCRQTEIIFFFLSNLGDFLFFSCLIALASSSRHPGDQVPIYEFQRGTYQYLFVTIRSFSHHLESSSLNHALKLMLASGEVNESYLA